MVAAVAADVAAATATPTADPTVQTTDTPPTQIPDQVLVPHPTDRLSPTVGATMVRPCALVVNHISHIIYSICL